MSPKLQRTGGVGTVPATRSLRGVIVATVVTGFAFASTSATLPTSTPAGATATAQTFSVDAGYAAPVRESATWSGYVVTPHTALTNVSANWKVSPVACRKTTAPQAAVFWVGLDGWYDKTVEQAGVEAYCSGTTPVYTAWWEMFPSNHITQVFAVAPGNSIVASVTYRNGVYTITVNDVTLHRISTIAARCPSSVRCNRSSAEWIAESPTYGAQTADLPPWSPLTFTGVMSNTIVNARAARVSGLTDFPVVMTGLHGRQAAPSPLVSGGTGFTESWLASI